MGFPPIPFLGPAGRGRRVNADGTITIICSICEKIICKENYRGYSTATCAVCAGELERGKRPEEIMTQTAVREEQEAADMYNDLGMGGFKVKGIGQRIKEVIEKVKHAANIKRRKPLFAKKDED